MITLARTIRHQRKLRPWLTQQWCARCRRRVQAQHASTKWFTLQAENDEDGSTRQVLASSAEVARVRGAGEPGSSSGQATGNTADPKLSKIMQGLGSRRLVLTATVVAVLIGVLAVVALAVEGHHTDRERQALAVQRVEITRLATQRDQALTAVRQARAREVLYRTQAARWRSRALSKRQPRHHRSRGGRRGMRRG